MSSNIGAVAGIAVWSSKGATCNSQ